MHESIERKRQTIFPQIEHSGARNIESKLGVKNGAKCMG